MAEPAGVGARARGWFGRELDALVARNVAEGAAFELAGNGFALLKLYERTGDARWLEQARRFAMHAAWQVERSRELFSQGRHSLWTGDIGTAVFSNECLCETARFPTLDVF